jgi:hypothetical protein
MPQVCMIYRAPIRRLTGLAGPIAAWRTSVAHPVATL